MQLLFSDYRELAGAELYDSVVSIEMIEAVGQHNLATYFGTIARLAKPGAHVVLQAISTPDDR